MRVMDTPANGFRLPKEGAGNHRFEEMNEMSRRELVERKGLVKMPRFSFQDREDAAERKPS